MKFLKQTDPVFRSEGRKQRVLMIVKLAFSVMIIFGFLYPDFIWNGDTASVTDQNGNDITDEMTGQEIYDGIYSSDEIELTWSFFNT